MYILKIELDFWKKKKELEISCREEICSKKIWGTEQEAEVEGSFKDPS